VAQCGAFARQRVGIVFKLKVARGQRQPRQVLAHCEWSPIVKANSLEHAIAASEPRIARAHLYFLDRHYRPINGAHAPRKGT